MIKRLGRAFSDTSRSGAIALALGAALISCTSDVVTPEEKIRALRLETLPPMSYPADNQPSAIKISLGKMLFWDPILSGQKDVACVSCHLPEYGYADGLDLSIGVGGKGAGSNRVRLDLSVPLAPRNASTIINTGYNGLVHEAQPYDAARAIMFWDGRKRSLESQCIGPLASFNTMRGNAYSAAVTNDSIVSRLKRIPEYLQMFSEAFGADQPITIENLARAIAAFERTLVSDNSPYDQYVNGNHDALTMQQQQGLLLFFGKANCSACHSGPLFSDFNFYNIGIPFNAKVAPDLGKDQLSVFRTPSLRNITLTAPYMHNGIFGTLQEVIDHYNGGRSANADIPMIDKKILPLQLTEEEKESIVSFLEALTDTSYDQSRPQRVPSGLKPGGNL